MLGRIEGRTEKAEGKTEKRKDLPRDCNICSHLKEVTPGRGGGGGLKDFLIFVPRPQWNHYCICLLRDLYYPSVWLSVKSQIRTIMINRIFIVHT